MQRWMRAIPRVFFKSAPLTATLFDEAEAERDQLARMRSRQQVQQRALYPRDRPLGGGPNEPSRRTGIMSGLRLAP
jgi:hypothetical protein